MAGPTAQGLLAAQKQKAQAPQAGLLSGLSLSPVGPDGMRVPPLLQGILDSAISGATFPGDVYAGRADPTDYGRALDTAGMVTLGAAAFPTEGTSLRMGAGRFKSASDVEAYAKSLGVSLDLSDGKNGLTVSKIVVPKTERGRGLGSEVMKAVTEFADETGKPVGLTPSTDFGASSKARLKDFYKKFGFSDNKGKTRDFTVQEEMLRRAIAEGKGA